MTKLLFTTMLNKRNHLKHPNNNNKSQTLDVHIIQTCTPRINRNNEVLEDWISSTRDDFPWKVFIPFKGPDVIIAIIASHKVSRIYMDGGSSVNIVYDHYFRQLPDNVKKIHPTTIPLIKFSSKRFITK